MSAVEQWFSSLWDTYSEVAPKVSGISALLEARGERVTNDHVAFRTFDCSPISITELEPFLLEMGYRCFDRYTFEAKRLNARSYVLDGAPRVFLSELQTERFSDDACAIVERLVAQTPVPSGPEVYYGGRLWNPITFAEYELLREETEYGAWVAAMGIVPNHFTVSVNALRDFDLAGLLQFIESEGFELNVNGGRIKGTPSDLLEQGSTLADRQSVSFADGEHVIPTCYYEFAFRHPSVDGGLFEGFVTQSADRIFESTTT